MKSRKPAERVRGEVYFLAKADEDFRKVDRFMGCTPGNAARSSFVRKVVSVTVDGGRTLEAWSYFYNRALKKTARPIGTGDWLGRY